MVGKFETGSLFFHVTLLDLCIEVCLPSHNNHKHLHLCKHMQSVLKLAKHFQLVARQMK